MFEGFIETLVALKVDITVLGSVSLAFCRLRLISENSAAFVASSHNAAAHKRK